MEAELKAIPQLVQRDTPFGGAQWQVRTAHRLGLDGTLRRRGRPREDTKSRMSPWFGRTVKTEPKSAEDSTSIVPQCAAKISRTMYSPSPTLPRRHCDPQTCRARADPRLSAADRQRWMDPGFAPR